MITALIVAILLVAADQVTKYLAVTYIAQQGIESVDFIPGVLRFVYSENDGMALGIGSESFRWIFVGITVLVCGVLIYLMFRENFKSKLYYASVALIVGGGIGNMIDRILYGYVVDFLSLSFFDPICNFADYCITAGAVTLIIFIIFFYGKKPKETLKKASVTAETETSAGDNTEDYTKNYTEDNTKDNDNEV